MTEAEWLTGCKVDELLLGLVAHSPTERKSLLFVVAATRLYGDSEDDSLIEGLEGYADNRVSREELTVVYRQYRNGSAFNGVPFDSFRIQNAVYLFSPQIVDQETGCRLIRDIFGNPFRPVTFDPDWRTTTAIQLAQQMYDSRDFSAMPILADAIQDAGCDHADILDHCLGPGPHVRGCWVVDLVLWKE
jgi:hypothetical protein